MSFWSFRSCFTLILLRHNPIHSISLSETNAKELEEIKTKTEEAIANAGDTEVLDSMFNQATHYTKIGDWDQAYVAYDEIINKEKARKDPYVYKNLRREGRLLQRGHHKHVISIYDTLGKFSVLLIDQ